MTTIHLRRERAHEADQRNATGLPPLYSIHRIYPPTSSRKASPSLLRRCSIPNSLYGILWPSMSSKLHRHGVVDRPRHSIGAIGSIWIIGYRPLSKLGHVYSQYLASCPFYRIPCKTHPPQWHLEGPSHVDPSMSRKWNGAKLVLGCSSCGLYEKKSTTCSTSSKSTLSMMCGPGSKMFYFSHPSPSTTCLLIGSAKLPMATRCLRHIH